MSKNQTQFNIKTSLSPDLRFLIACCQSNPSEADTAFILAHLSQSESSSSYPNPEPRTPNPLIALANQHGVLPLVYKTIKKLHTESNIDSTSSSRNTQHVTLSTFLSALKPIYISIVQRNMLMTSELLKIMDLLKENSIDALAFKGPTLAQMAYGDITLRQYGDLDILIRKEDRSKMMYLLIEERYIPEIHLKKNTKKTFFNSVNIIGLYKKTTRILVEVHWELLPKNYAIKWEEESLWSKKEYVHINNKKIPVLPTEQLLLYLCSHGSKHLFERLEWICDIDRSVRANPDIDWETVSSEASRLGLTRIIYLSLSLCETLFALELPQIMKDESQKDTVMQELKETIIKQNFGQSTPSKKSYSHFILLLKMREKLSDKLRFAFLGIFTPKFDDFLFIQLPNQLSFLYILLRPYRLIRKYLISK